MTEKDIYEKINESAKSVEIPDSLSPENIEKKLKNVSQNKNKKYSFFSKYTVAAAACLVVIAAAGVYMSVKPGKDIVSTSQNSQVASVGEGYEKAIDLIDQYYKEKERMVDTIYEESENFSTNGEEAGATNKVAPDSATNDREKSVGDTSDYSKTDEQVQGIEEGDIVKTDGKNIYTLKTSVMGALVTIYEADGEKVNFVSSIDIGEGSYNEMYVCGNKLVVIISASEKDEDSNYRIYDVNGGYVANTVIKTYDISDLSQPKEIGSLTQSGRFSTSRVSDGYVYIFSNYYVQEGEYKSSEPEKFMPKYNNVPAKEEELSFISNDSTNSYMVMSSISLDSPGEFCKKHCSMGMADSLYMSNKNIYVAKWHGSDFRSYKTDIIKYLYTDGEFKKGKVRTINGKIADSYYMHEYNDNFAFVFTSYDYSGKTSNGLCVLDYDMNYLGSIENLGVDERIYASYFIGNMAYFVTYRETDPVFAIDLSNPREPKLLSKLKLPGFSEYLHSFGNDMLLGVGMDDTEYGRTGKISLFSLDENGGVSEMDKLLVTADKNDIKSDDMDAGRDINRTSLPKNHKEIFVDEKRMLIGLPVYAGYYDTSEGRSKDAYNVYKVESGKIKLVKSFKEISSAQKARAVRIGEVLYVVDVDGEIKTMKLN